MKGNLKKIQTENKKKTKMDDFTYQLNKRKFHKIDALNTHL